MAKAEIEKDTEKDGIVLGLEAKTKQDEKAETATCTPELDTATLSMRPIELNLRSPG